MLRSHFLVAILFSGAILSYVDCLRFHHTRYWSHLEDPFLVGFACLPSPSTVHFDRSVLVTKSIVMAVALVAGVRR